MLVLSHVRYVRYALHQVFLRFYPYPLRPQPAHEATHIVITSVVSICHFLWFLCDFSVTNKLLFTDGMCRSALNCCRLHLFIVTDQLITVFVVLVATTRWHYNCCSKSFLRCQSIPFNCVTMNVRSGAEWRTRKNSSDGCEARGHEKDELRMCAATASNLKRSITSRCGFDFRQIASARFRNRIWLQCARARVNCAIV